MPAAHGRRGFSLISVVIGVALLAVIVIANVASLLYAARAARVVSYRTAARNAVQGVLEEMLADDYADVTPANYPSVPASDLRAPVLDTVNGLAASLGVRIEDERVVTSASSSTLTSSGANWDPDRWAGNTVFLVAGRGRGQRAQILSNTSNTMTISLIGYPQTTWVTQPDTSTHFRINGGKMVSISASFEFQSQIYTESVDGLVVPSD
jgi:Tfp pilus assembly protein PilV